MSLTFTICPRRGVKTLTSDQAADLLAQLQAAGDDGSAVLTAVTGWGGKIKALTGTFDLADVEDDRAEDGWEGMGDWEGVPGEAPTVTGRVLPAMRGGLPPVPGFD
jgi:hypothetical protein